MSKGEQTGKGAAAAVLLAVAAAGCGGAVNGDGVPPSSVEQKADTLTRQALDAIRPVTGAKDVPAGDGAWRKCGTETPGQHRYQYTYTVRLTVPQDRTQDVLDAARAHFTREGYRPDLPDPQNPRAGARDPHSSWWVAVGSTKGTASMFVTADSGCVFTTHDPRTAGS
ncbi:hypothetical protein [Actinacidiphila acidipaludis]|uniref:Lipoprotein n=1 Tax=Actinacidiphila acidipaludis TaxID=2873382 RepID=A0ABS7QCT4_9ACTN|nr:hypothetical protein [Streptomyces acidipaludis]MBY8880788.1 hypothetical protein [Streptomyces acidipaludis]